MNFSLSLKSLLNKITNLGFSNTLDIVANRKLQIFNQINILGFVTGLAVPISGIFTQGHLPLIAWIVAVSPFLISLSVLVFNSFKQYYAAYLTYFTFYPLATVLVYLSGIDMGIELFFILYGVLAIYFLDKIIHITLAFTLAIVCFLYVELFHQQYGIKIADINFTFYVANHVIALFFIGLTLFMTKNETNSYRKILVNRNKRLKRDKLKISSQAIEIKANAIALKTKADELSELNSLKDKLFSIISHDLKAPVFGLRNLFNGVHKHDLPAEEIKILIPDILNDLNYTTGLLENLLLWAKSQMNGATVDFELIEINEVIDEVKNVLRLQAEQKNIYLVNKATPATYIFADKNMMNLVLRNLVSNAIKFTPQNGEVKIGALQNEHNVEFFVEDTGTGMSDETKNNLFGNSFFTTQGTSNEAGTGLGLMLCKEFIKKNGGDIFVESKIGVGSKFICTLPIP
ncbi:ATP-binding protein [Ferruginibacter yonginensis]|uniref:histidine kinase n=1 Tax=Ferruginibacter yonginensis TaxID=1310416 RepID=A0ABV8QV57_9BACT